MTNDKLIIGNHFIINNPTKDQLGKGGMGIVYRGYNQKTGKPVAIKALKPEIIVQDPTLVARFKEEGEALRQLNHPNIVKLLTMIEANGQYYLIMEYVAGGSLRQLLDKPQPLSIQQVLQIGLDLADALTRAHRLNIIHRDIKPDNVLLAEDGTPRLADFGIAVNQTQSRKDIQINSGYRYTARSGSGPILGTINYLSPEICYGEDVSHLADIWSFGILLYEMLTKQVPFPGKNPLQVFDAILYNAVSPPHQYRPNIPPPFSDLIGRMLEKEPSNRIPSVRLVGAELEMLLQQQQVTQFPSSGLRINIHNYYYQLHHPLTEGTDGETRPTADQKPIEKLANPYRGLFHFGPDDAAVFFGRDAVTKKLLTMVNQNPLVGLLGASGSGKSSVVLAGLVPALPQMGGQWQFTHFRPDQAPFQALATALLPLQLPDANLDKETYLAQTNTLATNLQNGNLSLSSVFSTIQHNNPTHHLLLIADQFEELYTLCPDPTLRCQFLDLLLEGISGPPTTDRRPPKVDSEGKTANPKSKIALVFTMRADFLGHALAHRPFAEVLQDSTLMLGPMTGEELIEAIEKPAQQVNVTFEKGLTARILDDVGTEPGNLPLLEFALTLLWEKQTGHRLTHAAYEAIGRVEGALAHHANETYTMLSPLEQQQAHHIFIQLVRLGTNTEDTRRVASRAELGPDYWPLVNRLADARLVVTGRNSSGQETIEIVHEALIHHWNQLQQWLAADRDFRVWQDRLRTTLSQWQETNHDSGVLLRGVSLAQAEAYLNSHETYLNQIEQTFIRESLNFQQNQVALEKQRQQEKLEAVLKLSQSAQVMAEQATAREQEQAHAATILRRWMVVAVILAIVAAIFGLESYQNEQRANKQQANAEIASTAAIIERDRAATAEKSALVAKNEAEQAEATAVSQRDKAETAQAQAVTAKSEAENAEATAVYQRNETYYQAQVAKREQLIAQSKFSLTNFDDRRRSLPLLLAREAVSLSLQIDNYVPLAVDTTLRQAVQQAPPWQKTLIGHQEGVRSASFSPDGRLVVTGSNDKSARLWSVETGTQITQVVKLNRIISSVAFSPDGKKIAIGSQAGIVYFWSLENQQIITQMRVFTNVLESINFSPDGELLLVTDGDGMAQLWNVETKELLREFIGHVGTIWDANFSSDGKLIVTAGNDNTARLWSVETGESVQQFNSSSSVLSAQFSPDGKQLAISSTSGLVQLWSIETGQVLQQMEHLFDVWDVNFSPDGRLLITASGDDTVKVWLVETGELLELLEGHTDDVFEAEFSPDGQLIISTSADGTARLWSTYNYYFKDSWQVFATDFSVDNKQVVVGNNFGDIYMWDVKTGVQTKYFAENPDSVCATSFSSNGRLLATGGMEGTVQLWDVESGQLINTLQGHKYRACVINFSPDGKQLITGSFDGKVRIFSVESGEILKVIDHGVFVFAAMFSPDGQQILTGDFNGLARVWDSSPEITRTLITLTNHIRGVSSASYSPDGKLIVTGSGSGSVYLWNAETGQQVGSLLGHQEPVSAVAFSHHKQLDEQMLVTAGWNGVLRLWSVKTQQQIAQIQAYNSPVHVVKFSSDGQWLLSAGEYSTNLWPVTLEQVLKQATTLIQRNPPQLTKEEREQFGLGQ